MRFYQLTSVCFSLLILMLMLMLMLMLILNKAKRTINQDYMNKDHALMEQCMKDPPFVIW